mmetsp:Transcript_27803/g.76538  ORF Transcript_27803/g.76538 Transcript_27803/m.76538 type:complete len:282 (-) Transcript_27803:88-933(-)
MAAEEEAKNKAEEEANAAAIASEKAEETKPKEEAKPKEEPAAADKEEAPPKVEKKEKDKAGDSPDPPPSTTVAETPKEYSTPEITTDAAKHKEGLYDPDRPTWQNPLHHNNPEVNKIFREHFDSDEEFEAARADMAQRQPPLQQGDEVVAPPYLHELANDMLNLTMLEMNELVNKLQDHYGFPDTMMEPGEDGAGGDGDDDDEEAEAAEEKTAFDVKLVSFDAKSKIKVIKEVRAIAGLGLKEAKEVVDGAPSTIQKGVKKEGAEEVKAKLEELGAVVEIV